MKPMDKRSNYKPAEDREKDLKLALYRIQRVRAHTGETKVTIAAVASKAGVSSALIHNHYPNIAEATLERSRCSRCNHSVIGNVHAPFYQRLYDDLKELLHCKDIGEGGRQRVERDLNRCRDVLVQLGMPSEAQTA
ncbi:TetR/AcrR family transcriptional regulator [Pseudomonas sp. RA_5y_Pfl1_P24]|uniref:TetR/AcrR family transcriptional regulator n=1 Tax=Pseudomonas sp. RA_5y_Pfl1_P24 TaxID=3088706 RepID=UPI0030DD631E